MNPTNTTGCLASLIEREEINAAVAFWSEQLVITPTHDAGDPTHRIEAMAALAQSTLDAVKPQQVYRFKRALRALIACLCVESWREDDPHWGSGCRTVATDYGPDHTLECALRYADIRNGNLRIPIKTIMWISPGSVKVSVGYGGKQTELLQPQP